MSWAQGEFGTVDLGSERLNESLSGILCVRAYHDV